MGKEYKFDAFISYRHTEPDQFAAQLLHKRLEAFKLPKNVVSKLGPDGRKKISRVFRDQEELPLASNLADTITEALNESDFLIVICTPRLPESRWCRKEITTFLENHDRTHVLAVLLEGEPEQSFPEELRFIDEEITREDGTKETVRREIEPLAADFRGNTHKEISKKMDLEILRLLAPMFGVDFDDLRQRHRERKMKRIIRISAAISAVFFTFALVSTTMALRINKQNIEIQNKNTEIQQQNEEIQKQNDEIQEQNDKIEEQYREVLRSESTILATRSLNELDSGDRYKAIETALEALPGAPGKEDRPVVADAEYALTRALYVYDNGAAYRSQQMLEMQTSVAAITLSPEGDRFLGTDQAGNVMVWEGKTGKRLAKIQTNRTTFNDKDEAIFLDNDHIAVLSKDGFAVVDVPARETLYQNQDGSVYGLYTNRKGLLGAKGYNTAYLYDSMTGELKMEFPYPENSSLQGMFFDPDGKYVAFALNVVPENDDEWQKRYTLVEIYDATTLEKVQTIKRSHAMIYWVRLEGDSAYVAYADMIPVTADFSNFYSNFDYEGLVEKVSVPTAKTLWKNQSGDLCKMLSTARDGSWDYILSKSYQSIAFFNKEDGSLINRQEYESAIADLAFNADGSIVTVITTDGERHLYQPYNGNDIVYLDTFLVPCETVRNALFGTDYVAIRTTNSKSIYLMGRSEGTGYEPVWDNVDSSCLFAQFSHDGKYVITYDGSTDSHMNLVDLTTGNILRTLERDNGLSTYSLVGDGTEQYAFIQRDYPTSDKDLGEDYLPGTVTYYNMTDGSVTDTIKPAWVEEHASVDLLGITTDREHFIVRTTEKYDRVVKRINLRTNEEENKWYLPDGYSNSYAMAEDGTFAVTINSDDQTLNKFAVSGDPEKDRQAVTSISINAAFSTELFISSDGKYVGVGYQDHSAEIYLAEDLTLVRSFDSLDYTPDAMGLSDNGYYLHVTLGAYFMDDELNLKCWVGGFKELLPGGKEAYVTGTYGDIFKTPLYSLKELIQQAHALLDAKAEMTGNEE